jgi:hypothetical protein
MVLGVAITGVAGAADTKGDPTVGQVPATDRSKAGGPAKPSAVPVPSPYRYQLDFSTYFGGSGYDLIRDMTVDAQGNIYVAGTTASANFPRTPGVLRGESKVGAMVAKFSPAGRLIWSRVYRGPYGFNAKLDGAGCLYVGGKMEPGFPATAGAFQPATSRTCGFVGKLNPAASDWLWCSYVGTGMHMRDLALDDEGNVYGVLDWFAESKEVLPGSWFANAFCKSPHAGPMNHFGHCDAGIIKISGAGKVLWASWLGGTGGNDIVASVSVGKDRCPVIMLNTCSPDMPTTPEAFCRTCPDPARLARGLPIPWVGKLSADGSRLIFGTYLGAHGGMPLARTHNLAVDAQGNTFATFQAEDDLRTTPGAFQTKFGGGNGDAAIVKLSPSGALLAATYVGGSGNDAINGPDQIALDGEGNVMIACSTSSTDYPVTSGAFQSRNAGAGGPFPFDGAVSVLSNDLRRLLYSTYIGGTGDEMARACCFGRDGTLYLSGVTTSRDFPTKNAYQGAYGGDPGFGSTPIGGSIPVGWGNGDCWVMKFTPSRKESGK